MMKVDGEFTHHEPCEKCGSSDAKACYTDGHTYCFACESHEQGNTTTERVRRNAVQGLLSNIEYKALGVRKLSEETCRKFMYGYSTYKSKPVHVAHYFKSGQIVAQHLRTQDKDFPWLGESKSLELFGQGLWQSGGKRLVITEGEIDCMTVSQIFNLRWPVVSLPNGAQSAKKYVKQNLEYIESYEEIVLAFDNDEPGLAAMQECAMLLPPGRVKIANWSPYKDANEMLQDGRGAKIAEVIFQAKQFRPDGIIAGSDVSLESLMSEEDNDAYSIPYPKLNSLLKGLRKAEITTLTAGSGIGKSTLARELGFHLVTHHGLRVGVIALEESVKKSALGYIALRLNIPMGDLYLDKSIVPKEEFEDAYNELIASDKLYFYDHFGSLDSDNLVNKMRYLSQGLGVDFIILDHISIVVSGIEDGDERRIIDNLMTSLRSLVENTGVGMILISHLKVPQGTPHEEGGRVTMNQLRGSGSIKQLSDNIIGVERDQQGDDPDESQLRLLKNRLFGFSGLCDVIKYEHKTGRLLSVDEFATEFNEEVNDDSAAEGECPF